MGTESRDSFGINRTELKSGKNKVYSGLGVKGIGNNEKMMGR
jgi:hypothetical protein